MSFNGSGTFQINTAGQPVVSGTTISSTAFNALTADLATGLSTTLTKDGQSTPTANIPMGGYKITNLGLATLATDAVRLGQIQSGSPTWLTVSGTDTLTGSGTPAVTAYSAGDTYKFVVANTNTGAVTINIDGVGAVAVTRDGSTALVAGDLVATAIVQIVYDGTRFQVINANSVTNFRVSGTLNVIGTQTGAAANFSGAVTALTLNKVTITAPASGSTLTIADGKTLTASVTMTLQGGDASVLSIAASKTLAVSNSLTLAGTDATTMTFPGSSASLIGSNVSTNLTVGYTATPYNLGTITTGTTTLDPANGNLQRAVFNGAFTLAPPSSDCTIVVQATNGASAGAITTSGFTKVSGSFTTTNADDFMLYVTKINGFSFLSIQALQ